MIQDTLGDRLKAIEQVEAGRKAVKGKPLLARLDGRAFHTFTKGLARPYDERMSKLMIDTTKYLVEQTQAVVGYTQSDEISLVWYESADSTGQYLFDGKFQKLTSVLSSIATCFFMKELMEDAIVEKKYEMPTFDCRVWQSENLHDAYLNFLWRQDDAIKNAISMAAQANFSHKQLQNVNSSQKKEMLANAGIDFEAFPQFFKSGTFVRRVTKEVELTDDILAKIPKEHWPTGPVMRSTVEDVNMGPLRDYEYPEAQLLLGDPK